MLSLQGFLFIWQQIMFGTLCLALSSDVFGLMSFLECLFGQLIDLDCCELFLVPVDRQLRRCCDTELEMKPADRLANAPSNGATPHR